MWGGMARPAKVRSCTDGRGMAVGLEGHGLAKVQLTTEINRGDAGPFFSFFVS